MGTNWEDEEPCQAITRSIRKKCENERFSIFRIRENRRPRSWKNSESTRTPCANGSENSARRTIWPALRKPRPVNTPRRRQIRMRRNGNSARRKPDWLVDRIRIICGSCREPSLRDLVIKGCDVFPGHVYTWSSIWKYREQLKSDGDRIVSVLRYFCLGILDGANKKPNGKDSINDEPQNRPKKIPKMPNATLNTQTINALSLRYSSHMDFAPSFPPN